MKGKRGENIKVGVAGTRKFWGFEEKVRELYTVWTRKNYQRWRGGFLVKGSFLFDFIMGFRKNLVQTS